MKFTQKRFEILAGHYAKRFAKAWDYTALVTGAYLSGYRQAREDANLPTLGDEASDCELTEGDHQLSQQTMAKWKSDVASMSVKEYLKDDFELVDFRELKDSTGNITIQGIVRRK